jgi:hypothetical protein
MSETTVRPRLLPSGVLVCPKCRGTCTTPRTPNPYRGGAVEKLILKPGTARCPHCPAVHQIDREVARWHNAIWYAGDPAYAPGVLFDAAVPPPRIRIWTWRNATAAIRYLAPLVAGLRSAACRLSHLRLAACRAGRTRVAAADVADAEGEAERLADEIVTAGVVPHGGPLRGIVLFPSFVHRAGNPPRGLYLVWRDSRDGIVGYLPVSLRTEGEDLAPWERPVPRAWKEV